MPLEDSRPAAERRLELGRALFTMSERDEALRSLAVTAPDTEAILEVTRALNAEHAVEGALPQDEVSLLRHLVRIGADQATLWKLLVTSRRDDLENMRRVLQAVGEETGGVPALLLYIRPSADELNRWIERIVPDQKERWRVLGAMGGVDRKALPVERRETATLTDTPVVVRYALAQALTERREGRGADEAEADVYREDAEHAYPMPCYVSVDPPSPESSHATLRIVFPMVNDVVRAAEIIRVPLDQIDRFAKFLTFDDGMTLEDVIRGAGPYQGSAVLSMAVGTESGRPQLPGIFRKHRIG